MFEELSRYSITGGGRHYSYNQQQNDRQQALEKLATTAATLPFDRVAVHQVVESIRQKYGEELVVEAVATIAAYESITRVADATVRIPPERLLGIVKAVNCVMHRRREIAMYGAGIVVAIGAVWWVKCPTTSSS